MKKNFLLLVIASAIAIGGGLYVSDKLSSDTSTDVLGSFKSWKTFESKNTGISLKYPADWTVDDSMPDTSSFTSDTSANTFSIFRTKGSSKKQTLSQWLKARDKERAEAMGGQSDVKIISKKNIKVGKQSATRRVENVAAAGIQVIQTYVKNGDYFYFFTLGVSSEGSYTKDEEKVYDKILTTVTFKK